MQLRDGHPIGRQRRVSRRADIRFSLRHLDDPKTFVWLCSFACSQVEGQDPAASDRRARGALAIRRLEGHRRRSNIGSSALCVTVDLALRLEESQATMSAARAWTREVGRVHCSAGAAGGKERRSAPLLESAQHRRA
jgi:hypothetical protein